MYIQGIKVIKISNITFKHFVNVVESVIFVWMKSNITYYLKKSNNKRRYINILCDFDGGFKRNRKICLRHTGNIFDQMNLSNDIDTNTVKARNWRHVSYR